MMHSIHRRSPEGEHRHPAPNEAPEQAQERPPIMGTWPRLYALVLVLHAILIVVYYAISQHYR